MTAEWRGSNAAGRGTQVRDRVGARIGKALAIAASLAIVALPSGVVRAGDGRVQVQGSSTFNARVIQPHLAEIERLAGRRINVVSSKSVWGLIALVERRAELAMISGGLPDEVVLAKKAAPQVAIEDFREFEVSRSRIAYIVNPANAVQKLKLDDVRRILLGEAVNWRQLGGKDQPIRVVAVHDGGGTVVATRTILLDGKPLVERGAIRLENPRHVLKVVAQEAGAFGIARLDLVTGDPGVREVETDRPVEQSLSLVTLGEPAADVRAVIEAVRSVADKDQN